MVLNSMMRQHKVTPAQLIGGSTVLMLITWFIARSLISGQFPSGARGAASAIISREDQPADYWVFVGFFIAVTLLGWFAVGLNAYRLVKGRAKRKQAPH
jgi:hypothetical protein